MLGFNQPMRVVTNDRAVADKICSMVKHLTGDDVEPKKLFVVPHDTLPQAFGEVMHGLALNPEIRIDKNIVATIRRLTVGWMESYHRFFLPFKSDPDHPAVHGLAYDTVRYAAALSQEPPAVEDSTAQNDHRANKRRSPRRPQV